MGLRSTIKGLFNKKQDFLEADPYWETKDIPINTFKNKAPFTSKVVSTKRIVGAKATGETCHIIMDHQGKMPYWEGQSYGVIPPGTNPKNGKPNSVRLYSIASSRYGDDMTGTTTSLCVRRANYWCPELKADDPAKKGVCSNFLCDTKPGDEVMLTGPSGKVMLIPEKDPKADLIMVATGTGIAPYRSIIRRLFVEKTPCASLQKTCRRQRPARRPTRRPRRRGEQRDAPRRTATHRAAPCHLPRLPASPPPHTEAGRLLAGPRQPASAWSFCG
jgi:ferredoxin--NADP+ reductase